MKSDAKILITGGDAGPRSAYSCALAGAGYEVIEASSGAECLSLTTQRHPDIVLLDVSLPDLDGIEVCKRIKSDKALPTTFVINISDTQFDPDELAYGLEVGADTYLVKPIQPRVLLAQVRALLRIKRAEAALVDQQEREMGSLNQMTARSKTAITAQMFGAGPLRETASEAFVEAVASYDRLLDLALEQRAYKVENNTSSRLQDMAERLGFLNAGPRDVIDLHSAALKVKVAGANAKKAQAYVEEGRLVVIELMGYLVSYYRNRAVGARRGPIK